MSADTFCVKPLTHLFVRTTGQYGLCCLSKDSYNANANTTTVDEWWESEYIKTVRKDLVNGKRIPECSYCWKMEDLGITSMRQKSNQEYLVNKDNYEKLLTFPIEGEKVHTILLTPSNSEIDEIIVDYNATKEQVVSLVPRIQNLVFRMIDNFIIGR